jgi:hypothetical protein
VNAPWYKLATFGTGFRAGQVCQVIVATDAARIAAMLRP